MPYTDFRYTDIEAEITAKWQVGVRNRTLPMAILPLALILVPELLSMLGVLSLPGLRMTGPLYAAGMLYLLFILFILYRIRKTANELKTRMLAVRFEEDTLDVKTGEAVYITRYADVRAVDYGAHIVRVQSDHDAFCIPRRLMPNDFIDRFEQNRDVIVTTRRWM